MSSISIDVWYFSVSIIDLQTIDDDWARYDSHVKGLEIDILNELGLRAGHGQQEDRTKK